MSRTKWSVIYMAVRRATDGRTSGRSVLGPGLALLGVLVACQAGGDRAANGAAATASRAPAADAAPTGGAGPAASAARTPAPASTPSAGVQMSPAEFVQGFYDRYLPLSAGHGQGPAWGRAVAARPADFAPELARALQDEAHAQDAAKGEVAGLDFDPFLNSQDPCDRYEAGTARPVGAGYAVDVYGVCSGTRNPQPDVIAALAPADGSWQITNFQYPNLRTDLMRKLRSAQPAGSAR